MSLFPTAHIGELTLQNRIVMAPLGRARNSEPGREPQHCVLRAKSQRRPVDFRGNTCLGGQHQPPR
jgi:N-ethylmaleimide reductase